MSAKERNRLYHYAVGVCGPTAPKFSRPVQAMVEAAIAEGFALAPQSATAFHLYRADRHGNITAGIRFAVSETGAFYQANRIDIDLSLATAIWTVKTARQALYLKADKKRWRR